MEKKLTAQGPKDRKSYTVTLPLDWVRQEGLNKSKSVELEIIGKKVLISPKKEVSSREIVDLAKYPHVVTKVLPGLYRMGINEIKLLYHTSLQLQEIVEIVNSRLIGYEIIEQTKEYVLIKDITTEAGEEFETLLRRVFLLLLELIESRELSQINILDQNIKKIINYCQRILIKKGHTEYTKTPFYFVLLDQIEKITDEYTWLLQSPPHDTKLVREMNRSLRKAYELYYKFNPLEFDAHEYTTFQLRKKIRSQEKLSLFDLHIHNLARQLNTVYGTIFALRYK